MKNIFEGAKFGDKFLTRDGAKAVFGWFSEKKDYVYCMNEELPNDIFLYHLNGDIFNFNIKIDINPYKIVSRYQEPIDENKLDDLATIESGNFTKTDKFSDIVCNITYDLEQGVLEGYYNGFKAGYRKAMKK